MHISSVPSSKGPGASSRIIACLAVLTAALMFAGGCAPTQERTGSRARETSFWPLFPAEPRIQFLRSYQFSEDVEPERGGLTSLIYGEQRRVLPISKPYGLAFHDGRIYICDTGNRAVVVLDLERRQTRVLGASGMSRMQSPTDVAVAADGSIYVSDAARGAIFVFDGRERHIASFGRANFRPTGIALHGDELFICDFNGQEVVVMDRHSGEVLRAFGEPGSGPGQFVRPLGIDVAPNGTVYVSDAIQGRVQKFRLGGEFIGSFGQLGNTAGSFARAKHLAVDAEGIVYVVDAAFANVQLFNDQDQILTFFGLTGPHPGSMGLPAGVSVSETGLDYFRDDIHPAFDAKRLIFVTNQFGANKVAVYALGQLKEGKTPSDVATSWANIDIDAGQPDSIETAAERELNSRPLGEPDEEAR